MMTGLLPILMLLLGLGLGVGGTWLVMRAKHLHAVTSVRAETQADQARLGERVHQEVRARESAEEQLRTRDAEKAAQLRQLDQLRQEQARLETTLRQERRQAEEKLQLLDEAQQKLGDAFKAAASDALAKNNHSFLQLAQTKLEKYQESARGDLEKRQQSITELLTPVRESLKQVDTKLGDVEKSRLEAYAKLRTEVETLAQTHKELRGETARLVKALRRPEVRGRWGEIQLRRVVELAGMVQHCDFLEQPHVETEEGALRPDMIVRLPGEKNIVVDSKAPINAYLEAVESDDETHQADRLASHAQHIRGHVRALSRKSYQEHVEGSPEFIVLFLPIEACLSAALARDPRLIEYGAEQNVIIATPTTLISLLRAVYYGWRQQQLAENAKHISELGCELYRRIATFTEHMAKLGKSITSATKHYNGAVGSLERKVLVQARKFPELGATPSGAKLPEIKGIEEAARSLSAPELLEREDPDASGPRLLARIDEASGAPMAAGQTQQGRREAL